MFHRVTKRDPFLRAFQYEILSVCFLILSDRLLLAVQRISPFRRIRTGLLLSRSWGGLSDDSSDVVSP